ncbi:MAG: SDR family oxidoreductase, partial [Litorimonas sp.]
MAPRSPDQVKAAMVSNTSLGRYATPDAVANVILFLASDEASIVTGSTYLVDGGMLARHSTVIPSLPYASEKRNLPPLKH